MCFVYFLIVLYLFWFEFIYFFVFSFYLNIEKRIVFFCIYNNSYVIWYIYNLFYFFEVINLIFEIENF